MTQEEFDALVERVLKRHKEKGNEIPHHPK